MAVQTQSRRLRTKTQMVREIRRILYPRPRWKLWWKPAWFSARRRDRHELVGILDDIGVDCSELWDRH